MRKLRKTTYFISAFAVAFFFLFPEPKTAVLGALIAQTLAFIVIAGKSPLDGFLLCGISALLIGLLPGDHPLVAGSKTYEDVRWPIIIAGVILVLLPLSAIIYRERKKNSLPR